MFFGVQGRDKGTINRLRELFEEEWKNAIVPHPASRDA